MKLSWSHRRVAGLLAVVAVGAGALLVSPTTALDRLRAVSRDPFLFGAVLLGLYLIRPLFAWPTTILSVAVGYGYGFLGIPVALSGIALTTVPPFLAVRWFDRGTDVDRIAEASERFFATTGDFRGVVAARIAPIPADAVTCAAGLGDVRLRTVVAGTVVGEVPWTVLAVAVGTSADRLTAGHLERIGVPASLAMLAIATILLAGPARRALGDGS